MAIAALILGIIGLILGIFGWTGFLGIIAMILCAGAIVLGALGMKTQPSKKGLAIAGLVLGIVGLVFAIITFAACGCTVCQAACGSADALNEISGWTSY